MRTDTAAVAELRAILDGTSNPGYRTLAITARAVLAELDRLYELHAAVTAKDPT